MLVVTIDGDDDGSGGECTCIAALLLLRMLLLLSDDVVSVIVFAEVCHGLLLVGSFYRTITLVGLLRKSFALLRFALSLSLCI